MYVIVFVVLEVLYCLGYVCSSSTERLLDYWIGSYMSPASFVRRIIERILVAISVDMALIGDMQSQMLKPEEVGG